MLSKLAATKAYLKGLAPLKITQALVAATEISLENARPMLVC